MKKLLLIPFLAVSLVLPSSLASAMGSGDKFSDLQTGVTYAVYKPSNTLNLKPLNFEVRPCRLFPGKDSYLLAGYGGMDKGIALVESSAAYNCAGIDHPKPLGTISINGIRANLGIYCSGVKCVASKFSQFGGEITFTTPGAKSLKPTFIRLGTQGAFSQAQLIEFAKGLKRVG